MYTYYKSSIKQGHYYRDNGKGEILHVFVSHQDCVVKTTFDKAVFTTTFRRGDSCINNLPELPEELVPSTEEEFTSMIREAIFNLGIWELVESRA